LTKEQVYYIMIMDKVNNKNLRTEQAAVTHSEMNVGDVRVSAHLILITIMSRQTNNGKPAHFFYIFAFCMGLRLSMMKLYP